MSAALIARRLANQHLSRQTLRSPSDVVSWFGAMQAQEYGPAKWGVAQRAVSLTDAQVERAVAAGDILRTHILRPTWHFVARDDIRWMQALTSPRVHAANGFSYRTHELSPRVLARGTDVIARALEGGAYLTRQELSAALARARIAAKGQRLAYIVMHAELEAVICSGPRRGKQFTYALVSERAPRAGLLAGDEALAELTRRYFRSHGPATVRDYVWWSGLTVREAKAGIALAGLREERLDGVSLWGLAPRAAVRSASASVHLLPIYDEYLNAYRDRGFAASKVKGWNPVDWDQFANHVVADGRLTGTWRAAAGRGGVDVAITAHVPLSRRHAPLAARAVERFRRFAGADQPVALRVV